MGRGWGGALGLRKCLGLRNLPLKGNARYSSQSIRKLGVSHTGLSSLREHRKILAYSRKNPKTVWSGRMTPVWMRAEMKGTKLKKDDFLIEKA